MSRDSDKYLNKIVVARTAQGDFQFMGWCVGYCEAPTVSVWLPDGTQANWRADLVEVIEMPEEAVKVVADKFKPRKIAEAREASNVGE